jgi:tetratricopeptide (TPR) repeat protein
MMPSLAEFLGLLSLLVVPLSVIALALAKRRGAVRASGRILPRPIPKIVWWVSGLLIGAGVYLAKPRLEGAGAGHAFWALFVFLIGIAGLLIVLLLLVSVRPRHQRIARAMGLARSGQVDAAVAELQRQVETHGRSARRSGALGDCYLLREEWREAYIQFLDAEQLDGRGGRYLGKQGFALWKLGRGLEAIALLERAAQVDRRNPSHAWTACLILADLGRNQEARAQLDRAERLVEESIPPGTARRRALEGSIAVCRQRLEPFPKSTTESLFDSP